MNAVDSNIYPAACKKNPKTGSHLENFSLKDFLCKKEMTLKQQTGAFKQYTSQLEEQGLILYRRQVMGAASRKITINDPLTGEDTEMLLFGSNNYLALSIHPYVVASVKESVDKYGVGAGGPPLLNGTTELHNQLEKKLAAEKGTDSTILFSSGFLAQLGWMTALIGPKDTVFFDEYSHASLYDGMRLAKCRNVSFKHNDLDDLARKLVDTPKQSRSETQWICVEGVYSMDGDIAPLDGIVDTAKTHNCRVAVDDAHGTGVLGKGKGTAAHFKLDPASIDIHFGTFSKAFGTIGGFVCASDDIVNYMRFMSRSHMFSAALPAPVVASVLAGLQVMHNEPDLIIRLRNNVERLLELLADIGIHTTSDSAIIPIPVPREADIRKMALEFHQQKIFVNSVEYPAVPLDEQRFRISVMATHSVTDLKRLASVFKAIFTKHQVLKEH